MTGEGLWQRKTDHEVLAAVSRLHEYTEVGQAILLSEMERRGLEIPAVVASSCRNCGVGVTGGATLCGACAAVVPMERAAAVEPAPIPITFFDVGSQKFLVMSVCTFGLYSMYWFYENWKAVKAARVRLGTSRGMFAISPLLRAVFAPLWAHALFREVRNAATAAGLEVRWYPSVLAVAYVLSNVAWRVLAPLYSLPDQAAVVSLVSIVFLLPVQQATQRVNRAHGGLGDENARYSATNVACIVVGGVILALVIGSMFVPPSKPVVVDGGTRARAVQADRPVS